MSIVYGGYTFPRGFYIDTISLSNADSLSRLPLSDNNSVIAKYKESRKVSVRGVLLAHDLLSGASTNLRAQRDALKAALNNSPQDLYLESDRFLRGVKVVSMPENYEPRDYGRITDYSIDFIAADPFYYAIPENEDFSNPVAASPYSKTITAGGNVYALPVIALTCSAGTITLELENTTNGRSFTITTPIGGGQVIEIDALNMKVKVNGTENLSVFDGLFPRLEVGANAFVLTFSGANVTNFSAHWFDRYL